MKTEIYCIKQNNAMVRRGPDLPCYCLNYTKFGKLILRKVIEIAATRCHILKLKFTKWTNQDRNE